jgi:sulfoxide reductase heme-binding subunit YedZ
MSATLTSSFWYLSRGTGLVTLALLTLVVALGIATRSGRPLPGLPRFAVAAVHRSSSLLTLVFLGLHVGTLMFDKYAQLKLVDLVIPFNGTYRPLWLGLGTLASDLLLALVITSLLRNRLGPATWRAIHWTAYAAWPIGLLHALGTGTDAGQLWMDAVAAICAMAVFAALAWRMSATFGARPTALPSTRPRYGNTNGNTNGSNTYGSNTFSAHDHRAQSTATSTSGARSFQESSR